jgi:hypothetical protein
MGSTRTLLMEPAIAKSTDRRRETRDRVIKSAQMIFHDSVIDCTVMDVSPNGARVRTSAVVVTPEQVILQLRGGAAFFARRRWARGMEISFIFDGPAPLREHAAIMASSALEALPAKGLEKAIGILRAAAFFDDPVLGHAAEEAEAAYARLEAALNQRAKRPS